MNFQQRCKILYTPDYTKITNSIPLDSEEDYEYHAFVVYCDNDRKWVHNDLLDKLENEEGLQLCIHHRNFIVGDSFSVNVDNFLKKSWKVSNNLNGVSGK